VDRGADQPEATDHDGCSAWHEVRDTFDRDEFVSLHGWGSV